MQGNSSFAHPGNVLVSMFGDIKYELQSVAVDKVQNLDCIIQLVSHSTATAQKQI